MGTITELDHPIRAFNSELGQHEFAPFIDLTAYQAGQMLDLIATVPGLNQQEINDMRQMADCLKLPASYPILRFRRNIYGAIDMANGLARANQTSRITKHDFLSRSVKLSLINAEGLSTKPKCLPLEIQHVLGAIDQEDQNDHQFLQKLNGKLQKGCVIAYMQTTGLPNDLHQTLHEMIDLLNKKYRDVLDCVASGKINPDKLGIDPSNTEFVQDLQKHLDTLLKGAAKLSHIKILTPDMNDPEAQALEDRINGEMDKTVDSLYTLRVYEQSAISSDVKVALLALGFSSTVALFLSRLGIGNTQDSNLESLKRMIALLGAEPPDWIVHIFPHLSRTNTSKLQIVREFASRLVKDYGWSIATSIILTYGLSCLAQELMENQPAQLLPALVLAANPPATAYLTNYAAARTYSGNAQDGNRHVLLHPVKGNLTFAAWSAAAFIIATGMANQLNNPYLFVAAAEMSEKLALMLSSAVKYLGIRTGYNRKLNNHVCRDFVKAVKNLKPIDN